MLGMSTQLDSMPGGQRCLLGPLRRNLSFWSPANEPLAKLTPFGFAHGAALGHEGAALPPGQMAYLLNCAVCHAEQGADSMFAREIQHPARDAVAHDPLTASLARGAPGKALRPRGDTRCPVPS